MSRRRTREGYLFVKQSGKSAFGKSWKRKWVVVQPNNTRSQVGELTTLSLVLELYMEKGAYGKTVNSVLIEGATEVRRVISKSQSLAFEVRNKDKVLVTAAGESETESQEWMAMFRQQLLPIIKQKELSRLPEASRDGYKVSVIPNKYSEGLKFSGDMLAHVTSMTIGLYDIYEGTLIKEWDLRHTKRFSLQSKGPAKDVDRIAVIQISNRSPHGEGELLLFSLNAKVFLERIYENLNAAMNVKSKRTRTSSMLFEIPPKELEALGKEIREDKTVANGAEENGSAQKDEANENVAEKAGDEASDKKQADVGTQLSEKAENEDLVTEQDKGESPESEKAAPEEGATSPVEEKTGESQEDKKEDGASGGDEAVKKEAADADQNEKEEKVDGGEEGGKSAPVKGTDLQEDQEEQPTPKASGGSDQDSNQKVNEGENNIEEDKPENNTQQTVVEVHATEMMAEDQKEEGQAKNDVETSREETASTDKVEGSDEAPTNENGQEEKPESTVEPEATDVSDLKEEQKGDEATTVEDEAKQEETKALHDATENDTKEVEAGETPPEDGKEDAAKDKSPEKSSADDANSAASPLDRDESETTEKVVEVDDKSSPEEVEEQDNEPSETKNKEVENEGTKSEEAAEEVKTSQDTGEFENEKSEKGVDENGEPTSENIVNKDEDSQREEQEGKQSEVTKTGETTEEDVRTSPEETVGETSNQANAASEQDKVEEGGKDVNEEPSAEPVKTETGENGAEDEKSVDDGNVEAEGSNKTESKADVQEEKNENDVQEITQQVEANDET